MFLAVMQSKWLSLLLLINQHQYPRHFFREFFLLTKSYYVLEAVLKLSNPRCSFILLENDVKLGVISLH